MRKGWTVAAVGLCLAGQAAAHPHVYIDTGIEVIFDAGGKATALRISWTYDDFFSLMVVQDRGLDPDADGVLGPAEATALNGFDMDWDAGFPGDTYVLAGDAPVGLGRPRDWTAAYVDGKLVSTHLRDLATPVDPRKAPLIVQSYDPGFYTAYTIIGPAVLTGAPGCAAELYGPDLTAAEEELKAALAEYGAEENLEMEFPAVGAAYADEVRVTCAARS
jgi:ABC-type uncharacterized transport system substrate-binding protein